MSKGRLTSGILRDNYGTKQEIIDLFGITKGEVSKVEFLARLINDVHKTSFFTYLHTQHRIIFRTIDGFGMRYVLNKIDYDEAVTFYIGLEMLLKG